MLIFTSEKHESCADSREMNMQILEEVGEQTTKFRVLLLFALEFKSTRCLSPLLFG